MLTPEERVRELETAFYKHSHDRDRMAALLSRVADLLLLPTEGGPTWTSRWEWYEQQRAARYVRELARELLTVAP